LKKKGASIEKIQPLLFQAIFGALTRLNMNLFPGFGSLIALPVNTFFFLPEQFFFDFDKSEGSPWFSSGSFCWRSLLLILLSHYIVRSKRPDNVLHGF
jgi:hypothetical protein